MTNILLSGANGRMGRMTAECVNERDDCKIIAGIDILKTNYSDFPIFSDFSEVNVIPDVCIDFSNPNLLVPMLNYAKENHIPLVIATTGYSNEQISLIKNTSKEIPIFFSWNMSMGINLLIKLSKIAAAFLGEQFDIEVVEAHHSTKIDAPSGTALMIADAINDTFDNSKNYIYDRHSIYRKRNKKEIGIHSIRGGTITGEHEVIFAGKDEALTISHNAISRSILATGSINAANFIIKQKPGMYEMSDLI